MTETPIRVGIADDEPLIRHGLHYIINAQADLEVIWEAGDGSEAVKLSQNHCPDVVLMDVQMPNNGLNATRQILRVHPSFKIVILTTFDLEDYVYDGIRSGAIGYLLKDTTPQELVDSIRSAYRGESIFRTAIAAKVIARAFHNKSGAFQKSDLPGMEITQSLTERELEVLQQMAYGLRNDQIAQMLNISESTVKTHVHRILQKFGAEDRTQAVVFAIRYGIVR